MRVLPLLALAGAFVLLAPGAAAWSVTTPDPTGGGCQSGSGGNGPPGPYVRANGDCTFTVGCDDFAAEVCE
ncbi:MAG TPA: hypothetical protein VNX21_04220 [Candidatus Thermoplasmatota archaeon]|nr:hypothetical protein [Candidatus Thermoplasmatota archaeon]